MARKQRQEQAFNPLGWMFTFSDLVTLLLTFFVMLLSMKQPEITKLKAAFGVFSGGTAGSMSLTERGRMQEVQRLLNSLRQPEAAELLSTQQRLARLLALPGEQDPVLPAWLQKGLRFRSEPRGLVITLSNDLLFASGQMVLRPQARLALQRVASLLQNSLAVVSIEGHTDSVRPSGRGAVKDNWQLSLGRAQAVRRFLQEKGQIGPSRLRVAALADSRPVAPNDSPENRARNRRTEIILRNAP